MKKIIGIGIIISIFSGMFIGYATEYSLLEALFLFVGSFSLAGLILLSVWLIFSDEK